MNILEIVSIVILSLWWYLEIKTIKDDGADIVEILIPLTLGFIVFEVINHWKFLTQPLW